MKKTTKKIKFYFKIKYPERITKIKCKFNCDRSIADGIQWLNKNKYHTTSCCSGLSYEHQYDLEINELYICFDILNSNQICLIERIAKKIGFNIEIGNNVSNMGIRTSKENKLEMFNDFIMNLKKE